MKLDDNILDYFLADVEFVHNINDLSDRHGEDNCSDNSRSEFSIDGLNLRIDLVTQMLALSLFITNQSEFLQRNQGGSRLLRSNGHRCLWHGSLLGRGLRDHRWGHWRSLRSFAKCFVSREITHV